MGTAGWAYGLVGAVLAAGGLLLLHHRDMNTMDPWYLLLLVIGTAGVSFGVGLVLGHLTDDGLEPSSGDRE